MGALTVEAPLRQEQKTGSGLPVYTVVIRRNEDGAGYWATCPMPNGGANTIGDTIREVQANMFESMDLFLEDCPDAKDYILSFVYNE